MAGIQTEPGGGSRSPEVQVERESDDEIASDESATTASLQLRSARGAELMRTTRRRGLVFAVIVSATLVAISVSLIMRGRNERAAAVAVDAATARLDRQRDQASAHGRALEAQASDVAAKRDDLPRLVRATAVSQRALAAAGNAVGAAADAAVDRINSGSVSAGKAAFASDVTGAEDNVDQTRAAFEADVKAALAAITNVEDAAKKP